MPVSMRSERSASELQRKLAERCSVIMSVLYSYRELVRGELDRMDDLLGKPSGLGVDALVDAIMDEKI